MPGLNSKGFIIGDVDGPNESFMPTTKHGATVEGRYWLMLNDNAFTGDYVISPSETKTAWTTQEISTDNYSYALLNIDDGTQTYTGTGTSSTAGIARPNQTGRAREWKQSINTQAILISDRARLPSTASSTNSDFDKLYSVNTTQDDEKWAGSVGRGDGSASFENQADLDTKYGSSPTITSDRLFTREQDSGTEFDVISTDTGAPTWDVKANALLGYKGVGYNESSTTGDDAVASN